MTIEGWLLAVGENTANTDCKNYFLVYEAVFVLACVRASCVLSSCVRACVRACVRE